MAQTPTPNPPPPRRSAGTFLAWVWAGLLIGGGAAFLAANLGLLDALAPLEPLLAGAVAILSLPFIARWLVHRDEWWAPLTAWVFISMAVLILVLWFNLPYSQILGMTALVLMAVPFGAVWVANRTRWWAIISFYALIAFAGILGLTIFNVAQTTLAAFALLAAAAPFWVAYMVDRQRWWPLLPAGGLSLIAVGILTVTTLLQPLAGPFYVVLNLALALVCVALWLTVRRLDWALWLATGFVLAAVLSIWFPSSANWALVALALGVYIVYKQIDAAQKRKVLTQPPRTQSGQQVQTPPPAPPQAPAQPPAAGPAQRPSPPPPPPAPPAGQRADQEATAAHQARREAGSDTSGKPIVEFRPLDPFKARREQAQKDEENGGEDDE